MILKINCKCTWDGLQCLIKNKVKKAGILFVLLLEILDFETLQNNNWKSVFSIVSIQSKPITEL